MATTEFTNLDQRGMPASIDAEKSILGAVLLDNSAFAQASEHLKPEDFYLDSHQRIFARMLELSGTGRPIDMITLAEELGQHKELEAIGGVAYLSSLTDGLPRLGNLEHYVRIVRDKAMLRGLIHAAQDAIHRALDQSEPAEEIVDTAESSIFQVADQRIGQGFAGVGDIFKEHFGSLDELYRRGQRITGLETHYADLDALTSGLQPADLVIIAGRPSMGKTAFAMNIAENAAVLDRKVTAIFSLEMAREALVLRLLCSHARVDAHKLRTGFLGKDDFTKLSVALGDLASAPLYIDDMPALTLHEMRAKARRIHQRHGKLDLIVVDYLQLMSGSVIGGRRPENRTQEVSAISRGLKALAKEMHVPVVALSQLSRAPESRSGKDSEPKLSDLRESGSIEQDADVVAFLYRPEYYDRDNPELEGKAKLILAKQRNGPTDTIQLAFIKSSTRFETLDRADWIK
jgi:replicative DNA helicase